MKDRKNLKKLLKRLVITGIPVYILVIIYCIIFFGMTSIILLIADIATRGENAPANDTSVYQPEYKDPFFNQLHEQLFSLDMSKIPEDAALEIAPDFYVVKDWKLVDYLQAYMLACEICARPEINSDLANPEILPMDLLGSWFMESTLNYGVSVFVDKPYSYCRYIDVISSSGSFIGPYQQNKSWSINLGSNKSSYGMGIYISYQENPDLSLTDRAYYSTVSELSKGTAYKLTKDTYTILKENDKTKFRQESAVDSEYIKERLKWGDLISYNLTDTRPNSMYLPDAMYTNAIHMRLALDGMNPMLNKTSSYGYNNQILQEQLEGLEESLILAVRKAITKDINSANLKYLTCDSEFSSCGAAVRLYVSAAKTDSVKFYYVDDISKGTIKEYMTGGGNLYQLLYGKGNTATKKDGNTVLTATDGLLYILESSNPPFSRKEAMDTRKEFGNMYSGAIYSQLFYGYINSQAGYFFNCTLEEIAQQAVKHEEWKYDTPPEPEPEPEPEPAPETPGESTPPVSGGNSIGPSIPDAGLLYFPVPTNINVSSYYGYRIVYGEEDFHFGIDISAPVGTAVYSAGAGTVTQVQYWDGHTKSNMQSYGNMILVDFGGGLATRYAHLSAFVPRMAVGLQVARGQKIGEVGNTGNSYGAHLHFEYRINGNHTNPIPYLDPTIAAGL